MNRYNVWFHDSHVIFTIDAEDNQEARKIANRTISIKQQDDKGGISE